MRKPSKATSTAEIEAALDLLKEATAAAQDWHGRQFVRRLSWGAWLDALGSGRRELNVDDVRSLFVAWWAEQTVAQRVAFVKTSAAHSRGFRSAMLIHLKRVS